MVRATARRRRRRGLQEGNFADALSGYEVVLDSLGGENFEKSFTVLNRRTPGSQSSSEARKYMGVVMGLLSRKVHKLARKLGVSYSFLFMQSNGAQLLKLAAPSTTPATSARSQYTTGIGRRPALGTRLPGSGPSATRVRTGRRRRGLVARESLQRRGDQPGPIPTGVASQTTK